MMKRIFASVAVISTFWLALGYYENFLLQQQASASVHQFNGDNTDYGLSRLATNDYSSVITILGVCLLIMLWARPVICLISRITAMR